jgi:hypothetical protein
MPGNIETTAQSNKVILRANSTFNNSFIKNTSESVLRTPELHPIKNDPLLRVAPTTNPLSSIDDSQNTTAIDQMKGESTPLKEKSEIIEIERIYPTVLTVMPKIIDINILYI